MGSEERNHEKNHDGKHDQEHDDKKTKDRGQHVSSDGESCRKLNNRTNKSK
jgi:hypothetical protein